MVQFNWKGTWLPNLPYNENVVVEYQNVNYISISFVPPTDVSPYYDPTHWDEMLVIFNTPTPTPQVTPTPSLTPTNTVTPTPTLTPYVTPSPTPTTTLIPTLTPTVTQTNTPTPSTTPIAITGYPFTLVVLPYDSPSTGNTIFSQFSLGGSATGGTTNPNGFNIDGVYWNSVDNNGNNRLNVFSGITGGSVLVSFTQSAQTAIYTGITNSFTITPFSGGTYSIFHNPNIGNPITLVQSASTNFVTGQTVYIGYTTI
jgi:hypothetical protein